MNNNKFKSVIDPDTGLTYHVNSKRGRKILKKYSDLIEQAVQNILSKGFFNGTRYLYNGLSACFFREIPGYAIYFQTYQYLNKITNINQINKGQKIIIPATSLKYSKKNINKNLNSLNKKVTK